MCVCVSVYGFVSVYVWYVLQCVCLCVLYMWYVMYM